MKEGRDIRYSDVRDSLPTDCEPEIMNAKDPLFILYTSGSTGKPKGVVHTTGRLCGMGGDDLRLDLRLSARRHLLVHRGHRLDHRPQLCRLRPARDGRDERDVRRRSQLSRLQPLLGNGRPPRRDDLLHRSDRDPRADARRRRAGEALQPQVASACSEPSASRSIPKRGNGIGAWSETAAARSSTPGGRPRPAESSSPPSPERPR